MAEQGAQAGEPAFHADVAAEAVMVALAEEALHVYEKDNDNRGPRVDEYQAVGRTLGPTLVREVRFLVLPAGGPKARMSQLLPPDIRRRAGPDSSPHAKLSLFVAQARFDRARPVQAESSPAAVRAGASVEPRHPAAGAPLRRYRVSI